MIITDEKKFLELTQYKMIRWQHSINNFSYLFVDHVKNGAIYGLNFYLNYQNVFEFNGNNLQDSFFGISNGLDINNKNFDSYWTIVPDFHIKTIEKDILREYNNNIVWILNKIQNNHFKLNKKGLLELGDALVHN
jgi:hypothetical protein